jgi:hypothetical protein
MSPLAQHILSQAQSLPEGGLLSPKDFLHLGSRAAVDQTLSRLARDGKLLRLGRGAYAVPVQGRFGVRPPTSASVVQAIESAVTRSNEDDAWVAKALQARQNLLQTGMGVDGQAMAAYLKDKVRGIDNHRPPVQGLEQLLAPRS